MFKKSTKILPPLWRKKNEFIKKDNRTSKGIPISVRRKMWKKGFESRSYYLYGNIRTNGTKFYLSNMFDLLTHPKNGSFTSLIDNKLYLPYLLKDFQEFVPDHHYLLSNKKLMALSRGHEVNDFTLDTFKKTFGDQVVKEVGKIIGEEGGKGFFFSRGKETGNSQ